MSAGERVYQHVFTKSGELYSRELGVFSCDGCVAFDSYKYLNDRMQHEKGLLRVDDDVYVAMDCIARISYERHEVH